MISFPAEIAGIIDLLESRGHAAWAVGGCIRDSLLGERPKDWDLAVSAELPALLDLFPAARVMSRRYSVLRLEFPASDAAGPAGPAGLPSQTGSLGDETRVCPLTADLATFRTDGPYTDRRRPDFVSFGVPLEEDLARRDFTVNAICANPRRGFFDPWNGQADLGARLIRTVGNPMERLAENPIRMLRALRLAAELSFDLEEDTRRALLALGPELPAAGADRIRTEFSRLLSAPAGGRGLALMTECNLLGAVAGCPAASLGDAARERLSALDRGLAKAPREPQLRLGLFYRCLGKDQGRAALDLLGYGHEERRALLDALDLGDRVQEVRSMPELLDFQARYGEKRYTYLSGLMEAWELIFEGTSERGALRRNLEGNLARAPRPVGYRDLAVGGDDLLAAGVPAGRETGRILAALLELVHREPGANTKDRLLAEAKILAGRS